MKFAVRKRRAPLIIIVSLVDILIILLIFFVMSFLTNILGPIVPDIIDGFHVGLAAAAILPFAFFIAYGVMSIPAGFLVERLSEKPVMVGSFVAGFAGVATPANDTHGHPE